MICFIHKKNDLCTAKYRWANPFCFADIFEMTLKRFDIILLWNLDSFIVSG